MTPLPNFEGISDDEENGGSKEASLEDHLALGLRRERQLDFARAVWPYRRAVRASNFRPEHCFRLGYCYERLGEWEASRRYYSYAARERDAPAEWRVRLAVALRRLGAEEEAKRHFSMAWAQGVDGAQAMEMGVEGWLPDATAFNGQANHANAIEEFSTLLKTADAGIQIDAGKLERLAIDGPNDVQTWLCASTALMIRGQARAALFAKRNAARALLDRFFLSSDAPEYGTEDAVAAALYLRDFALADKVIAWVRGTDRAAATPIHIDRLLCEGRVGEARALAASERPDDLPYRRFLSGKSCAVVGPAVNDLRNGALIDVHDAIVRTNVYSVDLLRQNSQMIGSKTDAVYYSTEYFSQRRHEIIDFLKAEEPQFVTCRHSYTARLIAKQVPGQQLRRWLSQKKQKFVGIGFALRHILQDLIACAEQPVNVFGADFYLGAKTHFPGYFDQGIVVLREYARHDVFDTFMFLEALRNSGAIRCDPILDEILEGGLHALCDRIEAHRQVRC